MVYSTIQHLHNIYFVRLATNIILYDIIIEFKRKSDENHLYTMNNHTKSKSLFLVVYLRWSYESVCKNMMFLTLYFNADFIPNLCFWVKSFVVKSIDQLSSQVLLFTKIMDLDNDLIVNRRFK